MRSVRDHGVEWLPVGLVVAGFAVMAAGWRGAARTLVVPFQIPYVVSGGIGGLALVVLGAGVFLVQVGRRHAADERGAGDRVLLELDALLAARDKPPAPTRRGRR